MFASFKNLIFGVPRTIDRDKEHAVKPTEPVTYLPASQVPQGGIEGIGHDGSTWMEWRKDPVSGEQWYVKTSFTDSVDARPSTINGIAQDDDSKVDNGYQDDEPDEEDRKRELMFRRHKLRAAQNPYGVPLFEDNPNDDE